LLKILLTTANHSFLESVAGVHPQAPNGLRPSAGNATPFFNSNPIEPKDGEFFSRSQLPLRFRYKAPKDDEMENITSGGAEIVF
jgi:small subunit ribosomal protein YMR-31